MTLKDHKELAEMVMEDIENTTFHATDTIIMVHDPESITTLKVRINCDASYEDDYWNKCVDITYTPVYCEVRVERGDAVGHIIEEQVNNMIYQQQ
jgi:hypothetical protein